MTSRLPLPPPVPRDECPTVAPLRDPEADAIVRELDALRRDLRTIARVHGCCEGCGAPSGEPGVFCHCESGDDERFAWEAF